MTAFFADLHIHSCLSPCADDEMTPGNLLGMAKVKGLDIVAIADHNCARNLPAAQEIALAYDLLLLPAMEITTREEVHLLAYFPTVERAMEMSGFLRSHLPPMKNKPALFGPQIVCDSDDRPVGTEDALLIGATDLSLSALAGKIRALDGVPVPAHINRGANGLLVNQGFFPSDVDFPTVEVWRALPCPLEATQGRHVLHSSDAHYLGDIAERDFALNLPERSAQAVLDWMRRPKE